MNKHLVLVFSLIVTLAGCANLPSRSSAPVSVTIPKKTQRYGPLVVNTPENADFIIIQDGHFVDSKLRANKIVFYLRNEPFQIGSNFQHLNIALTIKEASEISTDPKGFKASHLSDVFTVATEPDSENLIVYSGEKWSDGNNGLLSGVHKQVDPFSNYRYLYQVSALTFIDHDDLTLENFKGTIYGYICVYKESIRNNSMIMPIEFVIK
jgi:hypothetical protein